jgi:minor extracellular protease Epr
MGLPGQIFRKVAAALLLALPLLATTSWSHEENEPRDREREQRDDRRETREDRRGRETEDRLEREVRTDNSGSGSVESDNSGPGSDNSGSDDRSGDDDRHGRDDSGRGSSARFEVERDTTGHERVRREVLMVGDRAAIDTVRSGGFSIIAERPLAAFNETLARIRVRRGRSVEQTIAELQALAPLASIAPHHLFRPSGDEIELDEITQPGVRLPSRNFGHVGVIDTGADTSWPALARSIVQTEGFADGGYTARAHGTLVAEIVARSGASLTVADVFGVDADHRLIAPAAAIASAIDWLVEDHVPVINISIEGPDNLVLAHVIKRALAGGVAIVAAAGNGGPGAAPAFPAAYPGVIAVTAVDENGQVYRRANRGDYIAFAARGVRVASAYESTTSKTAKTVSGTSFASPVVAAVIARRIHDAATVQDVIAALESEAHDLGAPGRDTTYGWGELDLPSALTASSR